MLIISKEKFFSKTSLVFINVPTLDIISLERWKPFKKFYVALSKEISYQINL